MKVRFVYYRRICGQKIRRKDSFADWIQFQSSFDPFSLAIFLRDLFLLVSLDLIRLLFWALHGYYVLHMVDTSNMLLMHSTSTKLWCLSLSSASTVTPPLLWFPPLMLFTVGKPIHLLLFQPPRNYGLLHTFFSREKVKVPHPSNSKSLV